MTLTQDCSELSIAAVATPGYVPPSLLSVRTFLFEHGMPIVPWASSQEVLDDLHELLRSQQSNDTFWQSLHDLLQPLRVDLEALLPNGAKGNEALALVEHRTLLDEIRRCVEEQPEQPHGFAAFARRLSQHCLVLLLLLGGAATVSCGARTDDGSQDGVGAGGSVTTTGGVSSTGGHTGSGGASFVINSSPQGGSTYVANSGTTPCVSPGPSMADVRSIATQCIQTGSTRDAVLACLSTLNSSWQQGVESILNCTTCDQAARALVALANTCTSLPADYTSCWISPCYVYMGVRMD